MRAHTHKPQGRHRPTQLVGGELEHHTTTDLLKDLSGADEDTILVAMRRTIVLADQVLFGLRHLEALVMARQQLHLPVVEPVLEPLQVERVCLGEDGIVMVIGTGT